MSESLDAALLAAHDAGDKAALVGLYAEAATTSGDQDAEAFFLTQAYVFALDVGDPRAADLHTRLKAMSRDE